MHEVSGLIVQRRLHKHDGGDRFFKEPLDENRIRAVAARLNLTIDFIYGELPHFSSTLVRKAPGHWRSFLPQSVSAYLEARPHLLEQLLENLKADSEQEQQQIIKASTSAEGEGVDPEPKKRKLEEQSPSSTTSVAAGEQDDDKKELAIREASAWVMRGLDVVHALQKERGRSGLWLSLGTNQSTKDAEEMQISTDQIVKEILEQDMAELEKILQGFALDEVFGLALELKQVPMWLQRDRSVLKDRCKSLVAVKGEEGWMARRALVEKFNPRIDVLILGILRALTEIRNRDVSRDSMPELLWKWSLAKEALGRERAFVCAGGPEAHLIVAQSLEMRQRLNECIQEKDRSIARVLTLDEQDKTTPSAPDVLHRMLESLTWLEWTLMGSFAPSTPLPLVHKLLSREKGGPEFNKDFDVETFFDASTTAIDFLLTFTKALAASGCAS